jgi:hypothetical protein
MSEEPHGPQISADGRFFWDGQSWKPVPVESKGPGRVQGVIAIAGGALVLMGAFLPWLTATAPFVGTVNRSLVDYGSDGVILAALGTVALFIGLVMAVRGPAILAGLGGIVALALAALITGVDYGQVSGRVANLTSGSGTIPIIASVGAGPYVTALGIVVGAVGCVMGMFSKRATDSLKPRAIEVSPPAHRLQDTWPKAPPEPTSKVALGSVSPDGAWYWNGEKWLPTG